MLALSILHIGLKLKMFFLCIAVPFEWPKLLKAVRPKKTE